jgi:hypothetical protein
LVLLDFRVFNHTVTESCRCLCAVFVRRFSGIPPSTGSSICSCITISHLVSFNRPISGPGNSAYSAVVVCLDEILLAADTGRYDENIRRSDNVFGASLPFFLLLYNLLTGNNGGYSS